MINGAGKKTFMGLKVEEAHYLLDVYSLIINLRISL
jgi:hypothetical protein